MCSLCGKGKNQTRDPDSLQAVLAVHRKVRSRLFLTHPPPPTARPHLSLLPHVSGLVLLPSLFGQIGHLQPQVTLHPGLMAGGMRFGKKRKKKVNTMQEKPVGQSCLRHLCGKCLQTQVEFSEKADGISPSEVERPSHELKTQRVQRICFTCSSARVNSNFGC